MSRFGSINQGNRQDKAFLRRKENRRKAVEMQAKKTHKTRKCKCCKGEHQKQGAML